jgi:hypothetical protein
LFGAVKYLKEPLEDVLNGHYLAALQSEPAQILLRSALLTNPHDDKKPDPAAYFETLASSVNVTQV